jgi:hypothetical protein
MLRNLILAPERSLAVSYGCNVLHGPLHELRSMPFRKAVLIAALRSLIFTLPAGRLAYP